LERRGRIMAHVNTPHIVDFVGMFTGAVGVSIAVYLRAVCQRKIDDRYIAAFAILGLGAAMIASEPLHGDFIVVSWLRGLGYVVILSLELFAAWQIYDAFEIQEPTEAISEAAGMNEEDE
jgi:hypothetical protein